MRGAAAGLGALVLAICIGSAAALAADEEPVEIPARLRILNDEQVQQRLAFLEEQLEENRTHATWWQNGWTTFYALGIVIQSTRAGLEGDHKGRQGDYIVSAVKAAFGVTALLARPLRARNGADNVRALPDGTSEDRLRRLAVAEEDLRGDAEAAEKRLYWVRHAINIVGNAAGGVVVWKAFDDRTRAWRSAGVGMAIGEVVILSQPWEPERSWEEYQRRFDETPSPFSWRVVPTIGGLALQVEF